MLQRDEIKEALCYGSERKYSLFPEIHDKNKIDHLKSTKSGQIMLAQLYEYADTAKQLSPAITFKMYMEFERTGNRLNYENAYFERRKQLFSLVLLYILEGNKEYLPSIEEKLWEWCELYSWELPAHFKMSPESLTEEGKAPDKAVGLFAAETAFFFAELLAIIGSELDDFLAARLKKEIFRRVLDPYVSNDYWWETAKMNWSSVCAGSVGAAAIYLMEDEDCLSSILCRVIESMDAFIEAFDSDGLITEGLSYWNYGFSFYTYFSELLRERTSGRMSLLNREDKIKKIAELPQILQFPSKHFVNFSDSGSDSWYGDCGLFTRLEKLLEVKGYNYSQSYDIYRDHTSKWASMARRLFWTEDREEPCDYPIKSGMFLFRESEWLVDRRVLGNGAFATFAAKGGNNDEPHNHNDLGNFILHYMDENLFVDIGSPEYVKEYFMNETRYAFLTASSLGHSVPVINGKPQSYGREYCSKLVEASEIASKVYFKLDLTRAYPCTELVQFHREFVWDYENAVLKLTDKFEFDQLENKVQEVFITKRRPEISEAGKLTIHGQNSSAELLFPSELECFIEECTYSDHSGDKKVIYRTSFSLNFEKSLECNFKIIIQNYK